MRIEIKNDGKERSQSFEAKIDVSNEIGDAYYFLEATGYGPDKETAIKNLRKALEEVSKKCEENHEIDN